MSEWEVKQAEQRARIFDFNVTLADAIGVGWYADNDGNLRHITEPFHIFVHFPSKAASKNHVEMVFHHNKARHAGGSFISETGWPTKEKFPRFNIDSTRPIGHIVKATVKHFDKVRELAEIVNTELETEEAEKNAVAGTCALFMEVAPTLKLDPASDGQFKTHGVDGLDGLSIFVSSNNTMRASLKMGYASIPANKALRIVQILAEPNIETRA